MLFGVILLDLSTVSISNWMLYKIVPFFGRFHSFSPLVGRIKLALLKDLLPNKSQWGDTTLHAISIALVCTGIIDLALKLGTVVLISSSFFLLIYLVYVIPKFQKPQEIPVL